MIEAAFLTLLRRTPGVVALVEERIYPVRLPQGGKLPALTYRRISSTGSATQQGRTRLERVRVQVDVWSRSYDDVKALADALKSLAEFRGYVPGHEREIAVEFDSDRDLDEPALDLRHVALDFFVWG